MIDRNRVDKGVNTGGQFAKESRSEDSGVALSSKPVPPVKLDEFRRRTVPISFSASIDLGSAEHSPLPELPLSMRGLEDRPKVDYSMENGAVKTSISYGGESVEFWEDHGERYNSVANRYDGSEPWPDLDDEDREALVEWSEAVHDRVDGAVYGVATQMSMDKEWSKAISREVVQDYAPETFDERSAEMDELVDQYKEAADAATRNAKSATSARDALSLLREFPTAEHVTFSPETQETMDVIDGDGKVLDYRVATKWTADARFREDIRASAHGFHSLHDAANWRPNRY